MPLAPAEVISWAALGIEARKIRRDGDCGSLTVVRVSIKKGRSLWKQQKV
jgi:hypothetical protein